MKEINEKIKSVHEILINKKNLKNIWIETYDESCYYLWYSKEDDNFGLLNSIDENEFINENSISQLVAYCLNYIDSVQEYVFDAKDLEKTFYNYLKFIEDKELKQATKKFIKTLKPKK